MKTLLKIFGSAFAIGFSGAVAPGPLLVVCVHQALAAGFGASMLAVLGHALAELVLVILMLVGLARYLKARPRAFRVVKIIAGIVLLGMGAMMLLSVPSARFAVSSSGQPDVGSKAIPLLMGAAVSVGNPYFILWWATVGLGLLSHAARSGRVAVPVFYVGHILSDFAWFAFIAASFVLGRHTILGETSYRVLLGVSGVFMIAFGAYFVLAQDKQNPAKKHECVDDEGASI